MKYSMQRELVMQAVRDSNEHPTAEMVYTAVRKRLPNISLATVYRNLNLLASEGKILKFTSNGRKDRFDKTIELHGHAVCECCEKVEDIMIDLDSLITPMLLSTGFDASSVELVVKGKCKHCSEQNK